MTFIETNTTHHAVCLGGRALFFQVLMGPRERKSLSKVTQQVCGRASLSASRAYTFPWATFKEHSSDHRIQKKPIWALRPPWKPPPPPPPRQGGCPDTATRLLEVSGRQQCLNGSSGAKWKRPGDSAEASGKCESKQHLFLKLYFHEMS